MGLTNLTKWFQHYKPIFKHGKSYFPDDGLLRFYFVRAPWVFTQMWAVMQTLFKLPPGFTEKIRILGPGESLEALDEFVDRKWVPKYLGGDLVQGDEECSRYWAKPTDDALPEPLVRAVHAYWREHKISVKDLMGYDGYD